MIAPAFINELVNDTLYNLLYIEFRGDTLNKEIATDNLARLKKFGLHESAYNLLFEALKYQDIKWNKDSIEQTLTKSNTYIHPWFEDDTK